VTASPRIPGWLIAINSALAVLILATAVRVWTLTFDDLPAEELRMLRLVHKQVMQDHVQPHGGDELLRNAIEGMVKRLDDHSEFVPPAKVKAFETETTGQYEGIGLAPVPGQLPLTVHYLFEGGPAEKAGLAVGDRIVAVDGEAIVGDVVSTVTKQAIERIKGPPGTQVVLRIQRDGHPEQDLAVQRAAVQRPSVKWVRMQDAAERLGYLHIASFQRCTATELDGALRHLEELAGAPLRGLLIDLRFNTGGLLNESVACVNRFLAQGNIVSLKRRGGVEHDRHDADPALATHPNLPIVILVNEQTASASEVLSGALQDHGRAALVGKRTYGKGVVQSIFSWRGLDFRLKLTTSHYYTPNGRNIEGRMRRREDGDAKGGIAPDIEVALPVDVGRDVYKRLEDAEVPRRYKEAATALGKALGFESEPAQLAPEQDAQLARGLETLRERVRSVAAPATAGK
jgi:carboxyl-terminal processing protease